MHVGLRIHDGFQKQRAEALYTSSYSIQNPPKTHRESHAVVRLEALEARLAFAAGRGGQQDREREEH